MYYIPFDRSFLQLSNGIGHVMPSTDRKLELTAKASMAQPVSQTAVCSNGLIRPYRLWGPIHSSGQWSSVELVRNLVAHGDAREGKWRGNWRMEWVASTLTPRPNVVYLALLKLMRTPRLPAVDCTDAPTDLNGLVRFGERRNLISARVPSRFARAIWGYSSVCSKRRNLMEISSLLHAHVALCLGK